MEPWIYFIALFAFLTSAFAAVLGQGGGLMLMTILATFVPAQVLIPYHAVIQVSSNGSRALLALKHINWRILSPIMFGILLGALLTLPILHMIDWQFLQPVIGLYILWLTWGVNLGIMDRLPSKFVSLGLLQGSLGMLLGATGPLGSALLFKAGLGKHAIVASNAIIMLASHVVKIIFFTLMGVSLMQYWQPLLLLCLAAIAGSYLGTRLRGKLSNRLFYPLFKGLLTLLALRMVTSYFFSD